MAEAQLKVHFAGPHVTVQDGGRRGMMRFGVPASGAMDRAALAIANVALGNPPGAPVVEVSLGGLVLDCTEGAVSLAVAGGGFIVELDGQPQPAWGVMTLRAGQRLRLRPGPWGSWAYLAFAGRLAAPEWLGSVATHGPSGLGGGRLVAGQVLRIAEARDAAPPRPLICPVWARPRPVLRVVLGPQDRYFAPETLELLTTSLFHLTSAYDRMGVRLRGPALMPVGALSIPSEPILRGSVQVSGDGTATVLLADHQTTGGYPKIATVLSCDMDAFVQCRTGQAIGFQPVSPETALSLSRQRQRATASYLARLAG